MSARDHDDVGRGWNIGAMQPRRDRFDDDVCVREPFGVRELLAVIHDVNPEADVGRDPRELKTDVTGADDEQLGRWCERVDVYVHASAADQSVFLREVVTELVV